MAKAIITVQDLEDGEVDISVEFDPPLEKDVEETPAQAESKIMVASAIKRVRSSSWDLDEDVDGDNVDSNDPFADMRRDF
jgi:hypothetical protein